MSMEENNIGEKAVRGPSRASIERAAEHKETLLRPVSEEYRKLQMEIMQLEKNLNQGIEHTIRNPHVQELATEVGRKINQDLEALRARKMELENRIVELGGDPKDYTVQ